MKNDIHDLGLVLDSRVRLVLIESWDEARVLEMLTSLAIRRGQSIYVWSVTEGIQHLGFDGPLSGEQDSRDPEQALRLVKADPGPNLYVMCDLHPFLEDNPRLVRLLKEVAMGEAPQRPTLPSGACVLPLPPRYRKAADRGNSCRRETGCCISGPAS